MERGNSAKQAQSLPEYPRRQEPKSWPPRHEMSK